MSSAPDAIAEARAAANARRITRSRTLKCCRRSAPEKIICVGINYPERSAEYKDGREAAEISEPVLPLPDLARRHEQPIVRPKVSEKFDYEGEIVLVIGKEGRHIPQERRSSHIGGLTLGNEGSVRDWLRHGTLNVTQGKNFDRSGSLGPWIVPADDLDPAKPLHLMTRSTASCARRTAPTG